MVLNDIFINQVADSFIPSAIIWEKACNWMVRDGSLPLQHWKKELSAVLSVLSKQWLIIKVSYKVDKKAEG